MDKKPDFTKDAHWGKGGRYIVNADGKRVPAPPEEVSPPFGGGAAAPAGEAIAAQTGERPDNAPPGVQIDGQGLAPAADGSKPADADTKKPMKEKHRA